MYFSELLPDIDIDSLTQEEIEELFSLMEMSIPYEIPPKLQEIRELKTRIYVIPGGRGGGKTEGLGRLLVEWVEEQECTCLVIREVQDTLDMSSIATIESIINKFGHKSEWKKSGRKLIHKNGGMFFFCGMNERTNSDVSQNIKAIHNVKYCIADEAQFFSKKSLSILTPSIRGGHDDIFSMFSEETSNFIFFLMNIETEIDPVKEKYIDRKREDTTVIKINYYDNPFFPYELEQERQEDYKEAEELGDFDEYNHKWLGEPRSQEKTSLLLYSQYQKAISADLPAEGRIFVGVDVARSGEDATIFYKRHGRKIVEKREFGAGRFIRTIPEQADNLEDFIGHDKETYVNIDEGNMGAGLVDEMRERGYLNIFGITFQQRAKNPEKYANAISEMAYEFVKDVSNGTVDISYEKGNTLLKVDLCQRLREMTNTGKRSLEKKDDFKKRYGRSPDHGDALLLCYYNNTLYMEITERERRAMAERLKNKTLKNRKRRMIL
jgi:phage terminase large subunit